MALFNDQVISTMEDLRAYESSVLEMASSEGVDLTVKLSVAQREMAVEIERFLVEQSAVDSQPATVTLDQVVVTEALKQWHTLLTLMLSYRDAFHNQLNDRYESKWKEYERQAGLKSTQLFALGLGILNTPLAGADLPLVESAPGALETGMYAIRVVWQNVAGQQGKASEVVQFGTTDGSVPVVTPPPVVPNATGWNVYAGPLDGVLTRQNAAPLLASETWTMPAAGLVAGSALVESQKPDLYLRQNRAFRRG
ncbi:MAG: hypothetical protein NTV70_08830 [Acidobacteria bacterium]|nr:hypothetical protein [Acidobacteriota bacterium]